MHLNLELALNVEEGVDEWEGRTPSIVKTINSL